MDTKIKNLDGQELKLSEIITENNTPVVISFWATWCKPCIEELEVINEELEDWQSDYDFKFIAISIDDTRSVSKVAPFVNARDWEFEVYLDENSDLKRAMNFIRVPFTCIILNNKIIYRKSGHTKGSEYEIIEQIKKINQ